MPQPQNRLPEYDAEILVDEREDRGDGNFRYRFETSNGIKTEKVGTPGSEGQSNMQGAFRLLEIAEQQRAQGITFEK
ncbi:cuticle protein AMP1A-like [Penaeus monodon]|uniref:cuticle protein AMP1A-like n=1 Tax=Penaeus monodon TaxID=6687 RepID=UPI0018A6D4BE|nr:cuticle protein AMP1A-like [Penaeus monodon]